MLEKDFAQGEGGEVEVEGKQSVKNFYILKYIPYLFFGSHKNILLLSSS